MSASDDLLCLFNAKVQRQDDSYLIEIPEREISIGDIQENQAYRIAVLQTPSNERGAARGREQSGHSGGPPAEEAPVAEGDIEEVEIEDIGDKGDGIARVGPGYVVIVPDTDLGERVAVEITEARENVAFAEVVERQDRFS